MPGVGVNMGEVTIEGLPELLADLQAFSDRTLQLIDFELLRAVQNMVRAAKRAAPKNYGELAKQITYKKNGPLNYEYISGQGYSSYVEFGTKKKVRVPSGLENFAIQFKGSGFARTNLGFKQAIFEWAKSKGIDKKHWYPIYRAIAIGGIRPQPFFFPIFISEGVQAKARIENIINNAKG